MDHKISDTPQLPSEHIVEQLASIQAMFSRVDWNAQFSSWMSFMQSTFNADNRYSQIANISYVLQTLQESFSTYQQMQEKIATVALQMQSQLDTILQQTVRFIPTVPTIITQLTELQNRLSQLTDLEFQHLQDEFEPSDELVESLNSTLQKATNMSDETADMPCLSLSKSFIKENLIGILSLILTILFQLAPNAEHQKTIRQNDQIIEQNQKIIELDEKRNELLQDLANTVHLLSEDMNFPIDQEQTVAIESDEVVHSPTQDQDTDCHQENSD